MENIRDKDFRVPSAVFTERELFGITGRIPPSRTDFVTDTEFIFVLAMKRDMEWAILDPRTGASLLLPKRLEKV